MVQKNNFSYKYWLFPLLLFAAFSVAKGQANTMDSAMLAASFEMTNISQAVDTYDNEQFDINIISSDGTVTDTLSGICSIAGDNYRCAFDSFLQIQNNFVNLEVHQDGKIFVVSQPLPYTKQFFKGNIDQALFQQMNISSISITTVGSDKKMSFNFLSASEYNAYDITYDPVSYRVSKVYMQTKADVTDSTSTNYITTTINFQNFTSISPGSVSFDTSPYIYIGSGNVIQKQAAYNDYQIVDLLNQNN